MAFTLLCVQGLGKTRQSLESAQSRLQQSEGDLAEARAELQRLTAVEEEHAQTVREPSW
jgi:outer membrane protein TolC